MTTTTATRYFRTFRDRVALGQEAGDTEELTRARWRELAEGNVRDIDLAEEFGFDTGSAHYFTRAGAPRSAWSVDDWDAHLLGLHGYRLSPSDLAEAEEAVYALEALHDDLHARGFGHTAA